MRAITTRQPWAWAIMHADPPKDVENRTSIGTWRALEGQRIATHAGKGWSVRGVGSTLIRDALRELGYDGIARNRDMFAMGAVIGTVLVTDVHLQEPGCCHSEWAESEYYAADARRRTGLVHLVLVDPRPCEPIDCRGALGAWTVPDDVAAELGVRRCPDCGGDHLPAACAGADCDCCRALEGALR